MMASTARGAALLGGLAALAFAACGDAAAGGAPIGGSHGAPVDASASSSDAAPATSVTPDASAPDANVVEAAVEAAPPLHTSVKECFQDLSGALPSPDYDQFSPRMGSHCAGTSQQTIKGVERVVFLGDSITSGTPPTPANKYYRQLVVDGLRQRFGIGFTVGDCSKWGANLYDLMTKPGDAQPGQIEQCFPSGVETKKTLIVMTMGANDVSAWAKDQLNAQDALAAADAAAAKLGAALTWLKDPAHFPNGSWVVFGNTYEYTDTSGDLLSCPAARLSGFNANWAEGATAVLRLQELFMQQAVATKTDLVFLLEHFCGHGYRRDDPSLQCYRGPNSELWFDLTCYHPNEQGHAQVADLMLRVIDGD